MIRTLLIVAALIAGSSAGQSDAGVRGGHFGGVQTFSDGSTYTTLADFAKTGNGFLQTNIYPDGTNFFYVGTFSEFDLGAISIWKAEYDGFPTFHVSGICLFNFISTYNISEDGGGTQTIIMLNVGVQPARTPASSNVSPPPPAQ